MRRIDPTEFRIAHRGTSREINRQIALNLVRTRQPISRAELARLMGVRRGAISRLVQDLLDARQIFEGEKGDSKRGRKPQYLFLETRQRCVVAVDISASHTLVQVSDLLGQPLLAQLEIATPVEAAEMVPKLAECITDLLANKDVVGECLGIGVSICGLVDIAGGKLLRAPTLGWVDVSLRDPLQDATGLPVVVENNVKASVLAQLWAVRSTAADGPVVFVNASEGVGVGIALDGQLVRGARNGAGEFGHVPLDMDGPTCGCGLRGCWETYVSVGATVARYLGTSASWPEASRPSTTVAEIVARARAGDAHARDVLETTGAYLGRGLSIVIKAVQPVRIYMSGEITEGWEFVLPSLRRVLRELTLVPEDADTEIVVVPLTDQPCLRGAAALVTSPAFAAPVVA
ncbi:ROK family protein [Luteitalea sp.]